MMRLPYYKIPLVYRRLRRHQRLGPVGLRKLQDQKLRAIVQHSAQYVPYYRRLFKEAQVDPTTIRTVDDLSKIPITTKADIRRLPIQELQATNVPLNACVKFETSGTSGIPFTTYWNKDAALEMKFNMLLLQMDCGDSIFNKRIMTHQWSMNFPSPLQRLGLFRMKYLSPFDAVADQLREIQAYNPPTMLAIASAALILAKGLRRQPVPGINITRIFTLGELLDDMTRRMMSETFEAEVFDSYGASEVGMIYTECPLHAKHLQGDAALVEIVRQGEVLGPLEEGEVVVTNLLNYAMPFLRWNTGDLGYLINETCPCAWHFPLMNLTSGRQSDVIHFADDRVVSAQEAMQILQRQAYALYQFQIIHDRADHLQIFLVKGEQYTSTIPEELLREFTTVFGPTLQIDIKEVEAITRDQSGKHRAFLTTY